MESYRARCERDSSEEAAAPCSSLVHAPIHESKLSWTSQYLFFHCVGRVCFSPLSHQRCDMAEAKSRRDFAADSVRHSIARKARLQRSMSKDCIRSTQPHVYITSLHYPHVAFLSYATFTPPRPADCPSSRRKHDPEDWQGARPRCPFAHCFILRRERRGGARL